MYLHKVHHPRMLLILLKSCFIYCHRLPVVCMQFLTRFHVEQILVIQLIEHWLKLRCKFPCLPLCCRKLLLKHSNLPLMCIKCFSSCSISPLQLVFQPAHYIKHLSIFGMLISLLEPMLHHNYRISIAVFWCNNTTIWLSDRLIPLRTPTWPWS